MRSGGFEPNGCAGPETAPYAEARPFFRVQASFINSTVVGTSLMICEGSGPTPM